MQKCVWQASFAGIAGIAGIACSQFSTFSPGPQKNFQTLAVVTEETFARISAGMRVTMRPEISSINCNGESELVQEWSEWADMITATLREADVGSGFETDSLAFAFSSSNVDIAESRQVKQSNHVVQQFTQDIYSPLQAEVKDFSNIHVVESGAQIG